MKKFLFIVPILFILTSCTNSQKIDVAPPSSSVTNTTNIPTTPVSSTPKEVRTVPTPTYGSGKHTIEIFADFQCPACQGFSKGIGLIMEDYAKQGKATIVYRQFPLTGMHKNAYRDAIAALCGAEQGKYMETKKALYAMEEGKSGAKVTDEDRIQALGTVGLDTTLLGQCLSSDAFKGQVDADMARGDSLRVNGTPTIFIDEKRLDMSAFKDVDTIKSFLDTVLSE